MATGSLSTIPDADLAEQIEGMAPGTSAAALIEHSPDGYSRLWKKFFGVPADFDAEKLRGLIDQYFTLQNSGAGAGNAPICNSAAHTGLTQFSADEQVRQALGISPGEWNKFNAR